MKAICYKQYGGPEVLKIQEIPKPVPKKGEVRVRVHSSTVTAGSVIARRGSHPDFKVFTPLIRLMFGVWKPRNTVTGYEFSGTIDAIGQGVIGYAIGDRVFGTSTGLKQGSYAEYLCVPLAWKQGVMAHLPKTMSFEEGAALPVGGMTAYDLFSRIAISEGSRVMVYGASGSVGTYMVQLAKSKGAYVTAVCSKRNHELLMDIGADQVLDYKSTAYSNHQDQYDVIADAVGKMHKSDKKRLMNGHGKFISISSPTKEEESALKAMTNLVTEGAIKVVIDEIYTINQLQEAHAYAEKGHKRGNVVVNMISK